MISQKLINRYAASLLDIAVEKNNAKAILEDSVYVLEFIKNNRDFRSLIRNPIFSGDKKLIIFKKLFESQLQPLFISFLHILINHSREADLPEILKEYIRLFKLSKGIIEAQIITAVPLEESYLANFDEAVKKLSGYPHVELNNKVDKSLIGGFILRFEDKLLDTSVASKFNQMKMQIKQ